MKQRGMSGPLLRGSRPAVSGSLFGRVTAIALPLVLQRIFSQLQALIDQGFLGNLNPLYLSVTINCFFPFFASAMVLWSLGTGVTILVSQARGAGREEEALRAAEGSCLPLALLGVLLFGLWMIFPTTLLSLLGVRGELLASCVSFMRVLSFAFLLVGAEAAASGFLQGAGDTRPIFVSGVMRAGLNVLFDWLLIFGNLGCPRLALTGAAIATVASTMVADGYLFWAVVVPRGRGMRLRLSRIGRPSLRVFRRVATLGIPVSVESFLWFVGTLALIAILNGISPFAAGTFSLVFSIEGLPILIFDAIGRAATTLIGERTGSGDASGAHGVGWSCLRYVLVLSGAVAVLFLVLPREILALFTRDESVVNAAAVYLSIAAFTLFPRSGNIVIGSGIRGMGDTPWMLLTQILGTVFVVAVAAALTLELHLGPIGIFIAMGMDETTRFVLNGFRFGRGRPKALGRILRPRTTASALS